jgi:HlyD family secretion protein
MKRTWIVVVLIVVVAGALFIGLGVWNRRAQAQQDPLSDGEVYTVSLGTITEVVEATGSLDPVAQVYAVFSTPGDLIEITVTTGDQVKKGDLLARLDTTDLELQLAQAQAGVDVAQANLDKILADPREEDVTTAQSSLTQATANVEETRVTLSASTEQARLSWEQSANNLRDAQANYENIYWENREWEEQARKWGWGDLPDAMADAEAQAWRAVENAEAAMEQARLSYEQAVQREESSVRAAQSQVTSAWANLERLNNGNSAQDIIVAQTSVEQAQVSYDIAAVQLGKAYLKAPFDGIVAAVLAEEYTYVSSATPILVLIDPSSYHIDVEVDEIDIARIKVGQQARILLDALPDVELSGEVTAIALSPTTAQGVVTYRVQVQVTDFEDAAVLTGMTANVNIVTDQSTDVLIVPRRAVRIEDGQAYIERVLVNNQLERVPVEIGLGDPFYIEIVSGLSEGDQVFVQSVVQYNQAQQLFDGGPGQRLMGGGGS